MNESAPLVALPRESNALLRRVVVIGTVLSLGVSYGWMASFDRQAGGESAFRWNWAILAWILIGIGSSLYFWRQIWPPKERSQPTRKQIVLGSAVLVIPGLWWLTTPLWHLKGQTLRDVGGGLIAAVMVLSFGAWMVTRLIKAFENVDRQDLADQNNPEESASGAEKDDMNKSDGN
jgi:hypothetical protein